MTDLHARLLAAIDDSRDVAEWGCGCGSLTGALRAVVEHHTPMPMPHGRGFYCFACPVQLWPCSTIRVIADALGVKDVIEEEKQA